MKMKNPYNTERNKIIYDNHMVFSPDGTLMFLCNEKKLNWYLDRGLAYLIENNIEGDASKSIKLKFEPKGLGHNGKEFGLNKIVNRCVSCGSDEYLTRHHVVPYCYRKFLPDKLKTHNFHDVVLLCVDCHDVYEREFADNLKIKISKKYKAPIDGYRIIDNELYKYSKMCNTLLSTDTIPKSRLIEMRNDIKEFFNIKRLTKKRIKEISTKNSIKLIKTHGDLVVSKLKSKKDIINFIKLWRMDFIKNMDCQYLPENWNIEYKLEKWN